MTDWLRVVAPYHDYGWFIALLAWVAAAAIGRRTLRDLPGWGWLPWTAWMGAATAIVELVSYAWPVPDVAGISGRLVLDVLLGALSAGVVAGLIWTLPGLRGIRVAGVAMVLVAAGIRIAFPGLGAVSVATAGLIAASVHAGFLKISMRARVAVLVAGAALCLTSAGPLASLGVQPRRAVLLSEWSPVWSFAQAVAGLTALMGALNPWFAQLDSRRDWRPFCLSCAAWLLLGLCLAAAMSGSARRQFEEQALGRAHMAAMLMNKSALSELLGPQFQLTEVTGQQRPGDKSVLLRAQVPHLAATGYEVQHQLALIGLAGGQPDLFAWIQTPRSGWIARISPEGYTNNPQKKKERSAKVGLSPETAEDLLDWTDAAGRFLPVLLDWTGRANGRLLARAPLFASERRMVGWLVLEFDRTQWVLAQVQPRLQAYVVVAFGFGLAGLVAVQRVRTREREIARAAAAASMQANDLKTAFLAKVSHELRTPIQSVLGYGELLQSSINDAVARSRLDALRLHGELMLRLVNDLLDLSAIQAGAFRLVKKRASLTQLVHQTVESLRVRAESKGLALSIVIGTSVPPYVDVDEERIRQVVLNLVGNAIKFTDAGQVHVTLETDDSSDVLTLTVRDTGPGIPIADMNRLFQPFSRLDQAAGKEGTGLGLALTAGLCRGMGGGVSAENGEVGAVFRAWFCARRSETGFEQVERSSVKSPSFVGLRVLIADDNALVRELFLATLHEAGAKCAAVDDGAKALLAAERDRFDAIVLDLAMPRIDGLEVARRLRALRFTGQIVGVSAHAGAHEREEALAAGMNAFLVKPVRLAELLSALFPRIPIPPGIESKADALLRQLRDQFCLTARSEQAALAAAVEALDFKLMEAWAHHMTNSAAMIQDDRLFDVCAALEQIARAGDIERLPSAWRACETALRPWATGS